MGGMSGPYILPLTELNGRQQAKGCAVQACGIDPPFFVIFPGVPIFTHPYPMGYRTDCPFMRD